jgi:two-component system, cell cycle sensor histidine kinase and response regulator CckA
MALPLRLLLVEDSEDDAELMLRELRGAGYDPTCRRVQTAHAMEDALDSGPWDLVISDYVLPRFSAPAALALVQESGLDLPFIIVSGAIGEETAVQAMRAGARDYIMKANLVRLVPAIVRELREAETRRARKQLEEQVRQAQRLEAIGRLAGGVAHDFNNLLTVIGSRSQFLLERLAPDHPARREATLILDAAMKAGALTRQLLLFSRGQLLQTRALSLNAVVSEMEPMLGRLIGEGIGLHTQLDPRLGQVMADQGHLEQVVMNLAVNARDAMPEGGRLTIATCNAELDEAYCRSRVGAQPGPYVVLEVTDTGMGMDATTQAHLFEPFFTTKGSRGTGLGLSVVYGIVTQGGGFMSVTSEPGHGACFKIHLPRVMTPVRAAAPATVATEETRGTETILIVEDEAEVRAVEAEMLRDYGYTVLEARDGEDALAVASRHPADIHLLVTDIVMPQMGGRELVRRLTRERRDMRVLYVSGYTDESIKDYGALDAAFLEKPFTSPILARKVREVLGASKP